VLNLDAFQTCLKSAVERANATEKSKSNAQFLVVWSDITSTLAAMTTQSHMLEPQSNDVLKLLGLLSPTTPKHRVLSQNERSSLFWLFSQD
jgi:hypothetical protein